MSKIIAVFGATGKQGGSVVRNLLQGKGQGKWKVVAITRDPNSDKAKALSSIGAKVVQCDMDSAASVEDAVKGAYGVFGMTDFWTVHSADKEYQQGKNIVDAAKKAGVEHLVLSTLEDTRQFSGGKRDVDHFVSKGRIGEYLEKAGVPYTAVQAAGYYENLPSMVKPGKDGVLEFTLPIPGNDKYAQFSVDDTGLVVAEVFADKQKYLGKKIALVGESISADEMAAALSKHLGKQVRFNSVPENVFASFGFPGAAEIANMFGWFHEYGYYGEKKNGRDIWEGKKVAPLRSFEQWLSQEWKK